MVSAKRDSIEMLKKRLYARTTDGIRLRRKALPDRSPDVATDWDEPSTLLNFSGAPRQGKGVQKFFIFSLVFFLLSVGVSLFFFFGGSTIISSQNVGIDIQGPTTVSGGEILSLEISIQNKNAVALEQADLVVEYPDGTRSATDITTPLPRLRQSLGAVAPGATANNTVRAVLFGEENSTKEITVTVEYRLKDSNAIFSKEEKYTVALVSTPLHLSVDALKEVVSGQNAEITVTLESNANTAMKKVLLTAEYPPGFTFISGNPKPSFGNSVWSLGDIPVGGKRAVTIGGSLFGEDGEERVLRFSAGIGSETDEKTLATAFVTSNNTITIKRPFLSVDVALNGNRTPQLVAGSGRAVRADVTWTNNLSTPVTDAQIEVVLRGSALDKNSVSVEQGFYRSLDTTILFDKTTDGRLASIKPGAVETTSFTFSPQHLGDIASLKNPTIALIVNVKGKRVSEARVPENIASSASREVLVASDLLLSSRAVYFAGPFTNRGPLPPKVEAETTYTVIWTVTNSTNNVSGVSVTTTLPPYVRWLGAVNPSALPGGENLQFNPIGGTITWSIPTVPAGVGYASSPREVAFQIGLTPSVSQIGTAPTMVNEARIRGADQFTDTEVGSARAALTTFLGTDPSFENGQAQVIK